jgi:hypothetical protein
MRSLHYLEKNVFTTPFRLLPLAIFTYVALCFLAHPLSPMRGGELADPDDYMRLNQVIIWLKGQGWYDLSQARVSPGAHTIIHWARLVDLPIALIMLPFLSTLGLQGAAMVASWVVPLALCGLLLALACALAASFVGNARANLATAFVLFAPMVLFNFTPGRVDHHGYQILIAGFGLVCLHGMVQDDRTPHKKSWLYAIAAAFAFACGLWIGTEALPWIILFAMCLAGSAGWYGGLTARNAAIFGISFPASTALVLGLALPSQEWRGLALSWFSFADVIFAVLTGLVFIFGALLGLQTGKKYLRLAAMVTLASLAAFIFIELVPNSLLGPFSDYDPFNASTALQNINEARPLGTAFLMDRYNALTWTHALEAFARFLFVPLIALAFLARRTINGPKKERALYLTHGIYLLAALLLTVFWQVRVGHFMQMFAIAPLTALTWASWDNIAHIAKNRTRFYAEIAVFLVLGPLPTVLLPALFNNTPLFPNVVLFPAARAESACPLKAATEFLATTAPYATHAVTIMTTMNEAAEILFRTPHSVIGGNYNVAGNTDVFAFFNARDDAKALAIAQQWHVDLVLLCRHITPFFANLDNPKVGTTAFLRRGADGRLRLISDQSRLTMIERLADGQTPPWLKPVEIPGDNDYLLYAMDLPRKTGKGSQ